MPKKNLEFLGDFVPVLKVNCEYLNDFYTFSTGPKSPGNKFIIYSGIYIGREAPFLSPNIFGATFGT